jgi:hypothetical protein
MASREISFVVALERELDAMHSLVQTVLSVALLHRQRV